MTDGSRTYSDEEMEEIFRRALERQAATGDGFAHGELIAAAQEVGLDEEAIDRAVREVEAERGFEAVRADMKKKQREAWLRHLVSYLVIAGGFLGMHALGLVGVWTIWMAFGWGALLALRTFRTLRGPSDEEVEREQTRRNRKERRAAQAKARREARRERRQERAERARARVDQQARRREAGEELERVIEEGVTLLLGAAAKKLREAAERRDAPAPDTEFGRYVARKKADTGRSADRPAPAPEERRREAPRVRVDDAATDDEDEAELPSRRARRRRPR